VANKKEILILNCKRCKEDFLYEYHGSGKKPDYCPNCRTEVTNELKQKYKDNRKADVEVPTPTTTRQTNDENYADKIAQLLMQLDSLRVSMCETMSQMRKYQSDYDKNDQSYLHILENIDTSDTNEIQKMIIDWKNSRNNRRNIKDLMQVLSGVLDMIPYKSYANALPTLFSNGYVKR